MPDSCHTGPVQCTEAPGLPLRSEHQQPRTCQKAGCWRMIDNPQRFSQYLLDCFFAGYFLTVLSYSVNRTPPLKARPVRSLIIRGKQLVQNNKSFLQCVKTVPLTRQSLLPCTAQAHRHSEQSSHNSAFIPLVLLASFPVLPLLSVLQAAVSYFLHLPLCVFFF